MAVVAEYLEQTKCHKSDEPPLTFDEHDRALCARHATIFQVVARLNKRPTETPAKDDAQP